ncbi:MAG: VWA domain-containing protein [Planctomycetes bacterium]|nr:VWA domain-containing protein [Planctomycetota bacterium]
METWLTQYFVHSAYVPWGAALVAAPILIHLINRLRFRVVRFAAMEFLLQSQKRNRRRVLLEQILLLLLRIFIVLALVALIARLILDPLQLSLLRGARAHHVVVLDDSGSMRDRWGEQTAFQRGVQVVRELVAEGARRPGTQKFSLILLSNPAQPFFSERNVDELFLQELDMKLENLRCTHRKLSLAAALDAATKLLAVDRAAVKHLHVISDFRQIDWQDQTALSKALRGLHESGVTLNLVRTVSAMHQNLAVTELTGDVQVAAAGVPIRLKVAVKNMSDQLAQNVRLIVLQDGQKLPLTIQFESIEAGVTVQREFDLVFERAGRHQVQVELPGDSLIEDNSRFLALDISPVNRVLIIQGGLGSSDAAYLADALAADPRITGFAPQIENVDYLRKRPLDRYQSIFLLNVAELPADALAALEQFVAQGGGLAWFLGDQINPDFYTSQLYRDGRGLFPVPLGPAPRELPPPIGESPEPDLVLSDHPIFRVFSGQENPYIEVTRVYKYFPPPEDWERDDQRRGDRVVTIARLRNGQPLMLEHRFGDGRVVTCLTSCGPTWNNWALYASFVVLQLELQKHIARTDRALPQRVVGEPIRLVLDPSEYTDTVQVTTPELAGQRVVRLKAAPDQSDRSDETRSAIGPRAPLTRLVANFRETDAPGVYVVQLARQDQTTEERWLAYNFPVDESELATMTERDLKRSIGPDVPVHVQQPGDLTWIGGKSAGQEVRDWLLALLVILLLGEQLLAWHMGYHRRGGQSASAASGSARPAASPRAA